MLLLILLLSIFLASVTLFQAGKGLVMLHSGLRCIGAILVAIVLHSFLWDVFLVAHLPLGLMAISALCVSALVFYLQCKRNGYSIHRMLAALLFPSPMSGYRAWLLICWGILTILFIGESHRWGEWDAWAIWNLHARFLTDGAAWQRMFSSALAWSHPDYPLMLPSIVAMCWHGLGSCSPVVPSVIAYMVAIAVPTVVCLALRQGVGGMILSVLSFVFFIFHSNYHYEAASQYADTLLSLLLLLAFVLIHKVFVATDETTDNKANAHTMIFLAGFFVACCGWVKNEGLMLFAVTTLWMATWHFRNMGIMLRYWAGAALPLAVIFIFKHYYAPVNDLVSGQDTVGIMAKLKDMNRYAIITHYFWFVVQENFLFVFIIFVLMLLRSYRLLEQKLVLLLFSYLGCYFIIYLLTPYNLRWHLEWSTVRLFHQLYPAFVFTLLVGRGKGMGFVSKTFRAEDVNNMNAENWVEQGG